MIRARLPSRAFSLRIALAFVIRILPCSALYFFNRVTPNPPPPQPNQPPGMPSAPIPRKKRPLVLYGCGAFLLLLVVIVATVAITIWWLQRPIKPVVLSPQEKTAVETKLQRISGDRPSSSTSSATRTPVPTEGSFTSPVTRPSSHDLPEPDRPYVPGGKVLKLTEREVNGLLNENTDLGNSVHIEFGKDAINAYVVVPIPKDFPIGGGKNFRARARFALSLTKDGEPYAILEDVTVYGLSLPKAWLGGLKGQNLLADAAGHRKNGGPILQGIKSLRVEPGALVLEVED
jgi:hypothetical protein